MSGIFGGLVAMILLRYAFPIWFALPKGYAESGPSAEELEKRSNEAWKNATTRAAVFGVVVALAWCGLVALVATICNLRGNEPSVATFLPGSPFYLISALFGAMGALTLGFNAAMRKLLRTSGPNGEDEFPHYMRLHNLKNNYKQDNVLRMLTAVTAVLSITALILSADNYTRFTTDSIVLNPLFSFGETRHRYGDVSRIVTAGRLIAPNGNTVERRIYIIHFRNGDKWDSDNAPGEQEASDIARIVQSVAQKSGVAIQQHDVLPRTEL